MNRTLVVIFLCFFVSVCAADTIWIDVREPSEFARGHHPDAINIPYTVISENISKITVDKNADIRLYCRSGRRSSVAQKTLGAAGYLNVTNEGGYTSVMKKIRK